MSERLRMRDCSGRTRCGCKGPGAAGWLAAQGYRVPTQPNSAALDAAGVLVARLASSDFLIEDLGGALERVAATRSRLEQRMQPPDVYPVAREDFVIAVSGAGLHDLLRQTCSVDFEPLLAGATTDAGPIVLTSLIGVGVVAWPQRVQLQSQPQPQPALRLWSDPSFAHYFWSTLLEVGEADGGVVTTSDTSQSDVSGSDMAGSDMAGSDTAGSDT